MSYVEGIRKKIGHSEYIAVGAGVFIYRDNQVLLQRRSDNQQWSMHGGGMELGETVEEAAKRELFEEPGLTANYLELLGVFSGNDMRHTYPNGDKVSIVEIINTCNDFTGSIVPQEEEILELKWFELSDLPERINPPDRKAFQAFREFMLSK